ncbi:MAG: transposase [Prevotellaceae bacterium]|nr:transposase [Candidatus Faecinaster equi]
MGVMPDYIHLFVKETPTIALEYIVNELKCYSSVVL